MNVAAARQKLSRFVKSRLDQEISTDPLLPFPPAVPAVKAYKRTRKATTKTLQSVDLFSGAGGLTIGLHAAGFNPVLAVELDEDACTTYSGWFGSVPVEPRPVEEHKFGRFAGIDLIAGGPPCQPFSSGGKGLAAQDARDMIPEFIRAVAEAQPRAFLMENVSALFGTTHRKYIEDVKSRLTKLGYNVTEAVLNAAEYGVPQKRRRGFLVGLRDAYFVFPAPTHGPNGKLPFVPAGAVLDAEEPLGERNDSKVFYAKRPDLRRSPYDGQLFNGGGRPIDLDEPSHTILASAGGNKTHFIDTLELVPEYHAHLLKGGAPRKGTLQGGRRITVDESALLQTFPKELLFHGSRSSQYTQIGNAVPPLLASVLGHALRDQLR